MFKLESKFKPFGDQPKAIEEIVNNFKNGKIDLQVGMETVLCRYCS